jgi:tRNA A37 threonylcarbamoyladenosine dehydratase
MTHQLDNLYFERTGLLIGKEKLQVISQGRVAIFGLGGVGSFACEGLARSGLGKFILVDFDRISETNFNRQIIATKEKIGLNKVDVMKERIESINPSSEILTGSDFLDVNSIEEIINGTDKIDFCIEAIDSLGPKMKVIKTLLNHKIPFISSMGAGGRVNPFCVKEGILSDVVTCNLARRLKRILRKDGINLNNIHVVYSTEKGTMPEKREKWEEDEFQRGRVRGRQGSSCFVPAVFGMTMAYIAFINIMAGNNR